MKLNYTRTIRTWTLNGKTYEIRTTDTSVFWGIFENGKKLTDFMNCQGSCAPKLIREFAAAKGIAWSKEQGF